METALALPDDSGNSIDNLIAMAVQSQASVENLERLLAMRRELKAEHALSQYNKAMAAFQVACPIIIKKTPGARTQTGAIVSRYAPLDTIVRQTKQLIADHGFHYSIDTQPDTNGIHVYVKVHHNDGHMEPSHVYMPHVERTQVMTDAQVEMATMTIATRRAFCNAFGIITGDDDKDGQHITAITPITEETLDSIQDTLIGLETWIPNILKAYKVTALADMTEAQGQRCLHQLQQRLADNK